MRAASRCGGARVSAGGGLLAGSFWPKAVSSGGGGGPAARVPAGSGAKTHPPPLALPPPARLVFRGGIGEIKEEIGERVSFFPPRFPPQPRPSTENSKKT